MPVYNNPMSDLMEKLRRLRVAKGTRHLASPSPRRRLRQDPALPPGQEAETPVGGCFYLEERYPLDHQHGCAPLVRLMDHDPKITGQMTGDAGAAAFDLRRALFIDTETTGLGAGAGVLAFLIGAGYFEDDAFVLRQYFLRDPAEEPAALHHLADWSESFAGLVSFNGRSFDVPILQNRFILSRLRPAILKAAHLDLLPPSRRLWRGRFDSCRLSTLEREVLGVQRTQDDVLSWLIPDLYRQYLRGGDNGEMRQVLYHNAVDILSLVSLAERLSRLFSDPLGEGVDPRESFALGYWYEALDLLDRAEATYRGLLEQMNDVLPFDVQQASLHHLAMLLKRQDRRAEAVTLWIQRAMEDETDVEAEIELAKFYEWHDIDLNKALAWTEQALEVTARWPRGLRRAEVEAELQHRRSRLQRKIENNA